MIEIKFLTEEAALKRIPKDLLDQLSLNLQPLFLKFSLRYLKDNISLLKRAGSNSTKLKVGYLLFRQQDKDMALLPQLILEKDSETIHLCPAKDFHAGIIHLQKPPLNTHGEFALSKLNPRIQYSYARTGWRLENSLFEIFAWFPEEDRKVILNEDKILLKLVTYPEGKKYLNAFYKENCERMQNNPDFIERNNKSFFKVFGKKFKVILIQENKNIIGAISIVDWENTWHLTNALYKKAHAKVMFEVFTLAKLNQIRSIEVSTFEWCLKLFVAKILQDSKSISPTLLKKISRMNERKIGEIES